MIAGLLIVGLILMATAIKGTEQEALQLFQQDMLGQDGFIVWIMAIVAIGLIGYIPGLKTPSRYLLVLLGVVVVLRNQGLFQQAQLAILQAAQAGPAPTIQQPQTGPGPNAAQSTASSGGGGGGGSSGASTAMQAIGTVASIAAMF